MKIIRAIFAVALLGLYVTPRMAAAEMQEYYYAIEQNNVVCGYAHVVVTPTDHGGRPAVHLIDSMWLSIKAFGKSIEANIQFDYLIDSATGMYVAHNSRIEQGTKIVGASMTVRGDTVEMVAPGDSNTTRVALPPGTILQNSRLQHHVVDFFVRDTLLEQECRLFNEMDGTVNTVHYRNLGRESLQLAGSTYDALKVTELDKTTGVATTFWVDPSTGLLLKSTGVRDQYLTDPGVRDRIVRADFDERLFARVDTIISNPWGLSYMKVRAVMRPGGLWITPEGLTVPGQAFEGTVVDNMVDGVFEISHARYNGVGAPPFPPDFTATDSLWKYLQPQEMIESDDPSLIAKAQELTAGSRDSWEAVTRLSSWVNKEIGYDLPGGVTALKTYETRLGECGSHSNLVAAFCRAVGIPARCVFGCIYVPTHGGAFGQHAWNEVFMGEAGWIPIDATVDEVTFVDCSHIRIGEWTSKATMFNPEKMEIIAFTVSDEDDAGRSVETAKDFEPFLGAYRGPDTVLTILSQNNHLAIDIPRQMVFELKDPDEHGEWCFVLTSSVSVSFELDAEGRSSSLTIHQRQRFPRSVDTDSAATATAIPEKYRRLVGSYTLPMQSATLSVTGTDSLITLVFPGNKSVPMRESTSPGVWLADTGRSTLSITFDTDGDGPASAMRFTELVLCPRVD
ncbi:MAG: transglutaminase-like domain-containing protein [candidate division Zixibacteria bacterium]|jgi:transglutaminase-like putative cysteine protease|nr:transglutaminase-like domain-containing protein [candidate division Zixibacteria bacterium]